jgi:hypothetical protein
VFFDSFLAPFVTAVVTPVRVLEYCGYGKWSAVYASSRDTDAVIKRKYAGIVI